MPVRVFIRSALVPLLVGAVLLAGCGSNPDSGEPAQPDPDPPHLELVVDLDPADTAAVAEGVNAFGFDLLDALTDGTENTVASPLSAATLLAMVLAGTGGDTAAELAAALHLDGTRDVRAGALLAAVAETEDVTLSVANGLWGDPEVPFEADYLGFVQDTFDATYQEAELGDQATADEIDAWVDEHTEGRITEMAEELGLPDPDMALALLNAVYFLGTWSTEFDPADTRDQPFTLPAGDQVQVPLMQLREQRFMYAERDGYRVLRLPYGQACEPDQDSCGEQGRFGMEVLLPDTADGLPELLAGLDQAEWQEAVGALREETVGELALPRFTLQWSKQLKPSLQRLGVAQAFEPGAADFTPMSPADLFLEVVTQKTFIKVDEKGTEAAAATGGGVGTTSAGAEPVQFRVDRPFAFTISDADTGTILFLGAVTDPRG